MYPYYKELQLKLKYWWNGANSQSNFIFLQCLACNFLIYQISIIDLSFTRKVIKERRKAGRLVTSVMFLDHSLNSSPAILTTSLFSNLPSCALYQEGISFSQESTCLFLSVRCAQCHLREPLPDNPTQDRIPPRYYAP